MVKMVWKWLGWYSSGRDGMPLVLLLFRFSYSSFFFSFLSSFVHCYCHLFFFFHFFFSFFLRRRRRWLQKNLHEIRIWRSSCFLNRVLKNMKCNVKGYVSVREMWKRCDGRVYHLGVWLSSVKLQMGVQIGWKGKSELNT